MADRIVTIDVRTQGLVEAERTARQANAELDRLERRRNAGSSGSTSRAASAALSASGGGQSTGIGRGTAAGNSRGSGRDFARQAQGMGGLVQLYATFAANIFAVSTAFSMLSRSMDFKLMETGARQLSVTLGVSLNSVARSIQATTDGAVSLKDALGSAALASSAGLSTQQIGKLAKAAKHASIVMGRDMTDSLNRMFRGVAKVEPELLDELGIMVKVNDANTKYAKSIGKTVSALTDFERRQAFANAAISKAEHIYSSLENGEKVVNSFSQATASLVNALLSIGSKVGTTLSPILSALASSPTALYAAIAALAGLLLKTAIPAFKDLGAARLKALELDQTTYAKQVRSLEKYISEKRTALSKANEAEIAEHRASIAKVADLFSKTSRAHASLSGLIGLNPAEIEQTVKDFYTKLSAEIKRQSTKLGKLKSALTTIKGGDPFVFDSRTTFQPTDVQTLTDSIARLTDKLKGLKDAQTEVAGTSSRIAQIANAANTAVAGMELAAADTELRSAIAGKRRLEKKIEQVKLRSQAVELAESGAPIAGMKYLFGEIDKLDLSPVRKAAEKAVGVFNILTAAIGGFVSKITLWVGIFAIVSAALKAFTDWMGWTNNVLDVAAEKFTTAKESTEAFSTALVELGRSLDVSEYINRNVSAISLQAQTLEAYLSGLEQYKAAMAKTGSEGSISRWWERNTPFSSVGDMSTQAFKGITSSLDSTQRARLDTFSAKAGPTNTKFNTDQYQEYLVDLVSRATPSTPKGLALRDQAIKELNALHAEMESLGIASSKTAENLKLVASVEKVVSDNATDFIAGLAFQSKEFVSANNIFAGLAKTASVLADAGTKSREGLTALTGSLNTLSSSTTRVYSGLSATTIASLDQIQVRVDEIAGSKSPESEKQAKLKNLFSSQETIVTVVKANLEAANNLVALALSESSAKIASAGINKSLKRMGAVASLTGTTDSYAIKKQEQSFQDKLIKIQMQSLSVQQKMLEETNKLDKTKLKAAVTYAQGAGVSQAVLDTLFGRGTIKPKGLVEGGDPVARSSITEAQVKAAEKLLEAVINYEASIAGGRIAKANIHASMSTLSAELLSALVEKIQKRKETLDESEKTAEFGVEKGRAELARGLADRDISSRGLDYESLSNSVYKLSEGNEALRDALSEQAKITRDTDYLKDVLKFINEELKTKPGAQAIAELTSEKTGVEERLEGLQRKKDTNDITVKTEKLKESFEVLFTTLNFASTTLSTFSDGLRTSASLLDELTTILVDRPESLSATSSLMSLSKRVEQKQFEYEMLNYSQAKRKLELAREVASMVPEGDDPEEKQAELSRIDAKLFNLAIQQRSAEFTHLKAELAHDIKMREVRMKQAESFGSYFKASEGGFWSSQNWRDASGIFFTSLDDITGNITSSLSQFARGMADTLDKSIDLVMDSWRKGELTKKNIIPKLRNLASDMFAQMASNSMKQAIYGGMKDLGKWATGNPNFGKSDQDIEREKAKLLADKIAKDTENALVTMNPLLGKLDTTLEKLLEFLIKGSSTTPNSTTGTTDTTGTNLLLRERLTVAAPPSVDRKRLKEELDAAVGLARQRDEEAHFNAAVNAVDPDFEGLKSSTLAYQEWQDEDQKRKYDIQSREFDEEIAADKVTAAARAADKANSDAFDIALANRESSEEEDFKGLKSSTLAYQEWQDEDQKRKYDIQSREFDLASVRSYAVPSPEVLQGVPLEPTAAELAARADKANSDAFDIALANRESSEEEDFKGLKSSTLAYQEWQDEDQKRKYDIQSREFDEEIAADKVTAAKAAAAAAAARVADKANSDAFNAALAQNKATEIKDFDAAKLNRAANRKWADENLNSVYKEDSRKFDEEIAADKVTAAKAAKAAAAAAAAAPAGAPLKTSKSVEEDWAPFHKGEIPTASVDEALKAIGAVSIAIQELSNYSAVVQSPTSGGFFSLPEYMAPTRVTEQDKDGLLTRSLESFYMLMENLEKQGTWRMDLYRQQTVPLLNGTSIDPSTILADKEELQVSFDLTGSLKNLNLAVLEAANALGTIKGPRVEGLTISAPPESQATQLQGIDLAAHTVKDGVARGVVGSMTAGIDQAFGDGMIARTFGQAVHSLVAKTMYSAFMAEKGGIVGPMGALPVHAFASGGIASSPQLAIFGEGAQNEAFVPLPDNRSIPVTLTGGGTSGVSMGDTSIQVNISVNKDGSSDTQTDVAGMSNFGKSLSKSVKATVTEELIRQQRPGGILYRGGR